MTAQTAVYQPTPSQYASAALHLELRDDPDFGWQHVRIDGVRYVVIQSGVSSRVYHVRADARGCRCRWYQETGFQCSHMLAVRLDIAERAAIEIKHQQALQDWLDDLEAPAQPASAYQLLYPSCWTKGCDNDPEAGESGCHLHCNVDAF